MATLGLWLHLVLGLVWRCLILIFISRINLWSYFPFLPPPLPLLPALYREFDHFSQELGIISIHPLCCTKCRRLRYLTRLR